MKIYAILVIALLLSACLPNSEINNAKQVVSDTFKDPESTKFRNVKLITKYSDADPAFSPYVCGEVNAKNSYGAYTGYKWFTVREGDKIFIEQKIKGIDVDIIKIVCK